MSTPEEDAASSTAEEFDPDCPHLKITNGICEYCSQPATRPAPTARAAEPPPDGIMHHPLGKPVTLEG